MALITTTGCSGMLSSDRRREGRLEVGEICQRSLHAVHAMHAIRACRSG